MAATTDSPSTPLKVVIVGSRDNLGGAARAQTRIFQMLNQYGPALGIEVSMRVVHKSVDHPRVVGGKPRRSPLEYARYYARTRFRKYFPRKPFVSHNTLLHSQALHHSGLGRELNGMDADIFVLHWLGNHTLSIPEVGRLKKPVVWHLHDMWVFSGAEHYTTEGRAAQGYRRSSRPAHESGPDIDRETFLRKKRNWRKPATLIAPSRWLARGAAESTLTATWPIHVVPLPLDTDFWHPVPPGRLRSLWGLDSDTDVILFAAGGGRRFPHKGADLFFESLENLREILDHNGHAPRIVVVVAGEEAETTTSHGFDVIFAGHLDDPDMREAYSEASVLVVPSRTEAWGQVASEAQACGLPAVVFDGTGLTDVVEDRVTGYHARQNDPVSLAEGMWWVLSEPVRREALGRAASERAARLWHPSVIAPAYAQILREASGKDRGS